MKRDSEPAVDDIEGVEPDLAVITPRRKRRGGWFRARTQFVGQPVPPLLVVLHAMTPLTTLP